METEKEKAGDETEIDEDEMGLSRAVNEPSYS